MKRALFALMLACQSALAFVPAPGLWNDLAIDGQGFNIETQDNMMIVTAYVFDPAGNQIWYLASGVYDDATSTFNGTLANATNGSCLSCPYRAPVKNGNAGGNLKIVFSSRESATAYYDGGSRQITHYNYGYEGNTGYFYGTWEFSYQDPLDVISIRAQWATFPGTTYTDSSGITYASGAMYAGYGGGAALARYSNGTYVVGIDGMYVVGVDDGKPVVHPQSFFYQFTGDNQHMLGLGYLNSTDSTPYVAQGSRIFTPHQLTDPGHAIANPDSLSQRYEKLAAALRGMPLQN